MMFFLRHLFKKVRNPVLRSFVLGGKSTSWSQVTMKLLHKFLTQLGFKYFIANETESLGEIEGQSDTSESFMRTQQCLFQHFCRFRQGTWVVLSSVDPKSINWRCLRKVPLSLSCQSCSALYVYFTVHSAVYVVGQDAVLRDKLPWSQSLFQLIFHAKEHSFKKKHWKHKQKQSGCSTVLRVNGRRAPNHLQRTRIGPSQAGQCLFGHLKKRNNLCSSPFVNSAGNCVFVLSLHLVEIIQLIKVKLLK